VVITTAHYQKKYSQLSGSGFEGLALDIREYTQKAIEAFWLAGPLHTSLLLVFLRTKCPQKVRAFSNMIESQLNIKNMRDWK